ncbi:MAG: hypothetical protein AB4426_30375 [Xenococcaceae cyanobacterium]
MAAFPGDIFEDLNTFGMMGRCNPKKDPQTGKYLHNGQAAKSGLNKAIVDAAWDEFQQKVRVQAERWGKLVVKITTIIVKKKGTEKLCLLKY